MTTSDNSSAWPDQKPTALLVLADGTVLEGFGLGAEGHAVGEVCFNTAMTGYQEILTDPSYAGQLITFTFPHIGNVGTNEDDIETVNMAATPGARGVVLVGTSGSMVRSLSQRFGGYRGQPEVDADEVAAPSLPVQLSPRPAPASDEQEDDKLPGVAELNVNEERKRRAAE